MRFLLVTDTFPPLNNSGAVQLWDLARGFQRSGHHLVVLVASPEVQTAWMNEVINGIEIIRIKTPGIKSTFNIKRGFGELAMPFFMIRCLKCIAIDRVAWDGIIWYSPSIFFGPLIHYLKKKNDCKTYLIIRDIFPEWAFDMGLIKKGLFYFALKIVAEYQYRLADTIGIQTLGNEKYFIHWKKKGGRQLEVLHNWVTPSPVLSCSIDLSKSPLNGRTIFIYAGNMGVAQNARIFLDLALLMRDNLNVGFLFVGRGSELESMKKKSRAYRLSNVLFYEEIESSQIPGLYAQCHVGLIALDRRHQSHNIPGKFLSYLSAGLPVLADINLNNDLVKIIECHDVGQVNLSNSLPELLEKANTIIEKIIYDKNISSRCMKLSSDLFSTRAAVNQIVNSFIP